MQAEHLGMVVMHGAEDMGDKVNRWLGSFMERWNDSFIVAHECPRFTTGEGKARLLESVRGQDIYILSDVTNFSCTYTIRGQQTIMSPDDHYMDIKRIISACGGKTRRITVIMPYLYCGRQDKRSGRESLDAALMLREMANLGVDNVITFDAHNPCVENAIPYTGFDNIMPTYQMIKALMRSGTVDLQNTIMVSPDEGAIKRNINFAQWLQLEVAMFYKVRDLRSTANGRNAILRHEYIGGDLSGKDVIVADDVLATGGSLLSVASQLRERGASRIHIVVTFPQFTEGLDAFDAAFERGEIYRIYGTNLIHRTPELLSRPWYIDVDLSKYLAYIIHSIHNEMSIHTLLDPNEKIKTYLQGFGLQYTE